ncbi:MAG: hypothetical protein RRZ84_07800 [Romboutsia sp.]
MFKKNDVVIVKSLKTLLEENVLCIAEDLGNVYCNKDKKYVLFPDFQFFDKECIITDVDTNDADIPYFLSVGIWVPEFMITSKVAPNPLRNLVEEILIGIDPNKVIIEENKDVIYINKFNNKPFGKLFIKLIKLDKKIAEFSSTSFSKLKKHELQYIAKTLQDNGRQIIDYNKLTQKKLSTYCYIETIEL